MNEHFCKSIQISLKFAPEGQIDNKTILIQVMACRRIGDQMTMTDNGNKSNLIAINYIDLIITDVQASS